LIIAEKILTVKISVSLVGALLSLDKFKWLTLHRCSLQLLFSTQTDWVAFLLRLGAAFALFLQDTFLVIALSFLGGSPCLAVELSQFL